MALTFPTSPSDGDIFNINNDYYIRVGGKWTSAGLRVGTVPAGDMYAGYTLASFVLNDDTSAALDNSGDYKESDWWPFRAGSFTQGTPQTDTLLTTLFPSNAASGMWCASDHTIITAVGSDARTALGSNWVANAASSGNTQGFDDDMNQVTASSGNAPSFNSAINPGTFTAASNFGTATGIGIGRDDNNNSSPSRPATGKTWHDVSRLVTVYTTGGVTTSFEIVRGPSIKHSKSYDKEGQSGYTYSGTAGEGTTRYYDLYWRTVEGDLISTYNS